MNIETFLSCGKVLPVEHAVLLRGETGIGKSQVIRQLAAHFELPVLDKRLSQMSEGDMIGLPELVNGTTRFAQPDWYAEACKRPICLFFDELNRALPEVMQAAFQIILDRELNGMKLHPGTRVYAAVNVGSRYQVNEMDPALLNRFVTFDLEPTVQEFLEYQKSRKMHPVLHSFLMTNQSFVDSKNKKPGAVDTNRRAWERLDVACKTIRLLDEDLKKDVSKYNLLYCISLGYVGLEAATAFADYAKNIDRQLSVEDIIDNWDKNEEKIKELGVDHQNVMIDKIIDWASKNEFSKTQAANFGKFFSVLPGEARQAFWQTLAGVTGKTAHNNIRIIHEYIVEPLLAVFKDKVAA